MHEHEERAQTPWRDTADRRRPARPGEPRAALLALQRTAGNTAVRALLAEDSREATGRSRSVQRDTLRGVLHEALIGYPAGEPAGAALQRDLAADMRGMIDIYGPVHYEGVVAAIRAAPAAERRAALADTALMRLVGERIAAPWSTTVASALLEGTRTWRNPTGNDFFRYFVLGTGPAPSSPAATMNCWESIMYAAYTVGAVDAPWIKKFYVQALAQTADPTAAAYALLGWTAASPRYDPGAGRVPTTGQLVFYKTTGRAYPGHVAIYMGGGNIMSLWNQPNGIDHVQMVRITDISGTIYFGDAPW